MIVFQNSVVNILKKRRIKYVCLSLLVSAMTCTFFAAWNNASKIIFENVLEKYYNFLFWEDLIDDMILIVY